MFNEKCQCHECKRMYNRNEVTFYGINTKDKSPVYVCLHCDIMAICNNSSIDFTEGMTLDYEFEME